MKVSVQMFKIKKSFYIFCIVASVCCSTSPTSPPEKPYLYFQIVCNYVVHTEILKSEKTWAKLHNYISVIICAKDYIDIYTSL